MTEIQDAPDEISECFEFFYERGWTDGLPIIPPTPDLVQAMVAASGRSGSEVLGQVPPLLGEATVEQVAANAVMAGCLPRYINAIIAALEAAIQPEFNLTTIQTTGDSVGPALIINGPVREELSLNSGEGVAAGGARPNATMARAVHLILTNVGGARVGQTDRAVIGQPAKAGLCIAENEERSPWEPLHVARGYAPDVSAVTVVAATYAEFAWPLVLDVETLLSSMVRAMANPGHSNAAYFDAPVTWILPPENAHMLARAGYGRADVQAHLFEHARIPEADFPMSADKQMWQYRPTIVNGQIPIVDRPEDIVLIVAGGDEYSGALYLGGFEACLPVTARVSEGSEG